MIEIRQYNKKMPHSKKRQRSDIEEHRPKRRWVFGAILPCDGVLWPAGWVSSQYCRNLESVYIPLGFSFGGITFLSHACSDCWHPTNVKGTRLHWIWQQGVRMAFQQFYQPLWKSCSCDDKHASFLLSTLAVVIHRHESHFHFICNIQTTRCRICCKTPSGARLVLQSLAARRW